MSEINFSKEQELFHLLVGAYLSAKTYNEYCALLKHEIPTHNSLGQPVKGNKTLKRLTEEAEFKSAAHLKQVTQHLAKGGLVDISDQHVEEIENTVFALVRLSPESQKRVMNLVNKIKNDQSEKDFWENMKSNEEVYQS